MESQDISRLLSLAGSSISLLTLPQTDGPDDGLPQGDERSEQFVLEVSEYFERLDVSLFFESHRCLHTDAIYSSLYKRLFGHPWLTSDSPE